MFRFTSDDTSYHEEPVPPAEVIPALREVLKAIRRRLYFVKHPFEWSSELNLIDKVMALSAGGKDWPTHTVYAPPTVVVCAQKGAQG